MRSDQELSLQIKRVCDPQRKPDISIVVPVNAQGDLENVRRILSDIVDYQGKCCLEIILVVNNYPEERPPAREISELRQLGVHVLAMPNTRIPGEAPGFSARIPGVRAASAKNAILFDADCRIPNSTALIDWYIERFTEGYSAAYTHVAYYEIKDRIAVRVRIFVHHLTRWIKRNVLGIPTTRGSNYAVARMALLDLYDEGLLADEMNVGPTFKRLVGPVAFSPSKELVVETSGRMFRGRWKSLPVYFWYRLRYNFRVLPVRKGVASRTGREKDPARRYINNTPLK